MGRHTDENYPWHKNSNGDDNDSLSRFSFCSRSRSSSDDSIGCVGGGEPSSPRAADPGDVEAQLFLDDKKTSYDNEWSSKDKEDDRAVSTEGPTSPPRAIRWWDPETPRSTGWRETLASTSISSRSLGSWVSPSVATTTPPPPALRSSRLVSLPGAFPVAGISDGYRGEEEKFEDEPSVSVHSIRDEEILLLEATLVSDNTSKDDLEIRSNNELVFQAEPLKIKRSVTLKSFCCLICLLLVIAVVGVAAGTELGRRRYDMEPPKGAIPPPRSPPQVAINSTLTFAPSVPSSALINNTRWPSSEDLMAAPPHNDFEMVTPVPSPPPPSTDDSSNALILDALPEKTRRSLNDPMSPQFLAYKWLASDAGLNRRPMIQQLQRFALATLYFATDGNSWQSKENWLSYGVDECLWSSGEYTVSAFFDL